MLCEIERHILAGGGEDVVSGEEAIVGAEGTNGGARRCAINFEATAAQLFRVVLQNLADRSSEFWAKLEVEAEGREPFDPNCWLRNAVEEHFDEAGVERD
jgi:hypothetical protein